MNRQLLTLVGALIFLASCATTTPSGTAGSTTGFVYTSEVRKMSHADDVLFRDLTRAIGGVRFADEVYFKKVQVRRLEKIEVLVPYDNKVAGAERWFVNHDGTETVSYLVTLTPDGNGGTVFSVKLEK